MPRPKGTGKGRNPPITIRLPEDEEVFYRSKANQAGLSLNGYLTKLLVEGAVAGKVYEFEERMSALIASIPQSIPTAGGTTTSLISDNMQLSILTCEAMLSGILAKNDNQALYSAQEAAKNKFKKLRGG